MASGKGEFSGGKMNKEWDGRKERRWGKKKGGGGMADLLGDNKGKDFGGG